MKTLFTLFVFLCLSNSINAKSEERSQNSSNQVEEKMLLITGCGRSGTDYISKFLQHSGIDILHENPGGAFGCVSWTMAFDLYSPWGPPAVGMKFVHIFHQVRNPLRVISSWYNYLYNVESDEWKLIKKCIPIFYKEDSLIVHCVKYWIYWNLRAEAIAEWRYRIEDFENVLPEFEARLGITLDRTLLKTLPRNTNTWGPIEKKVTWSFLQEVLPPRLYRKLEKTAFRYGYPTTD